jgi:dihydroneopterin aldolase
MKDSQGRAVRGIDMGRIVIAGLRELGVHGVLPEEQTRPQPFEVDVELTVDLLSAGMTDDIEDTVDYSAVSEAISRVVRSERYQLLERLATRIAEVCRQDERVTGVVVTVRKLHPPVRAMVDHVAVRIEQ